MQQITIEQEMQGEIFARFVRYNGNFCLVAYHMHKDIPREEALRIKNQYGMKPYPQGYEGVVPKSLFKGGKLMIGVQN